MTNVDYIVAGQGIAGSAVAIQLIRTGKSVAVFDNPASNNSSRIAAGLFNPITGKKMVKTWLADTLFPYLREFYRSIESETGERFLHELPLYRPFLSIEEQNEWMIRSEEPAYRNYIERVYAREVWPQVRNPYGGLLLKNCGYIDTTRYIRAAGMIIRRHSRLIQEQMDFEDIVIDVDFIRYRDIRAGGLIICSGTHVNKWFGWLPIRALKGETLSIRNNFSEKIVVNRGVYMVPAFDSNSWRVGSTYNFQDRAEGPTAEGRKELEEKAAELFLEPFDVTDHQWGFRPTTPDRRPIIGSHPTHKNIFVFNGLGTKGISLAPYFSEVLVRWLENKGSLQKEVDIERFKSLYWGSPE